MNKDRRQTLKYSLMGLFTLFLPKSRTAKAGYGECSVCNCAAYVDGENEICQRCGHSYPEHW